VTVAAALLGAYLLGAVPVGYLVARAFGVGDIRSRGSGNIGATNVLRTLGRLPAAVTLVGDVLKGYVAVAVPAALTGTPSVAGAAAALAVVGNCWSVFLGFRGGKGVATGLGALLRLAPLATLPAALVWLVVVASFRYVSLASLTAAVCVPLGTLMLRAPGSHVAASAAVAVIVMGRHRDNIARLLGGTERRLGARAGETAGGRP
jgi:glycerol-3-phosphate acyltransferase PlsY